MKPTIAIPILLVAAIAAMGFSAWGPARSPETFKPNSDPPANREVSSETIGSNDPADDVRVSKLTATNQSNPPTGTTSSDAGEIDCPLLKTRPFRRTLGYPCLACASWMEANGPNKVGESSRRISLESDQSARAQAIDRLREHNIISAVDTRSSAAILWVMDGFSSLSTESMQKVVDLVFTHCLVADHAKNMLLIYDSATRERIGTFTELRGLRMVDQLAKG